MQCQAKAKSTGEQCQRSAVSGKRVCTVHGGLTPGGIASPNFKNGRYSKYLPDRLSVRYEQAVNDPQLLELSHEVALIDARLSDLLNRIETGETGQLWQDISKAWDEYKIKQDDSLLTKIDGYIKRGNDDYQVWDEIQATIEQRRRLVESERKRLVETQQYVTTIQAMTMISHVLAIIKDNVTDRETLQSISTGINRLVSRADVIDVS